MIENGRSPLNVGELLRLGEALGLSLDDLVKGDSWASARGRVMSLGDVLRMARIDSPEQLGAVGSFLEALVTLFHDNDRAANDQNEQAVAEEEGAHEP